MIDSVLQLVSNTPGKLPCTLIVLDEVQQALREEDPGRTLDMQRVVEALAGASAASYW